MSLTLRPRHILAPALIAAAAIAVPAGAHSGHGAGKTIKLVGTTTHRTILDLGEPGLTLGDQNAFSNDLQMPGSGKPAGIDGGSCTVIRVKDAAAQTATVQCRVIYALAGGQITTEGLLELSAGGFEGTQSAAITGGTGRYRHARGVATARFLRPGELALTLDLR